MGPTATAPVAARPPGAPPVPADTGDFDRAPAGVGGGAVDDDIPF